MRQIMSNMEQPNKCGDCLTSQELTPRFDLKFSERFNNRRYFGCFIRGHLTATNWCSYENLCELFVRQRVCQIFNMMKSLFATLLLVSHTASYQTGCSPICVQAIAVDAMIRVPLSKMEKTVSQGASISDRFCRSVI